MYKGHNAYLISILKQNRSAKRSIPLLVICLQFAQIYQSHSQAIAARLPQLSITSITPTFSGNVVLTVVVPTQVLLTVMAHLGGHVACLPDTVFVKHVAA